MVPVLVVDLNDAEAEKVLATFDPLAAMAEPDEAQLVALLKGIETDSDALEELLDDLAKEARAGIGVAVTEDGVPEPPDEAITKPGDLIVLGNHRLLCGDSSKPEDVDRLLGGRRPSPWQVEADAEETAGEGPGAAQFKARDPHRRCLFISSAGMLDRTVTTWLRAEATWTMSLSIAR